MAPGPIIVDLTESSSTKSPETPRQASSPKPYRKVSPTLLLLGVFVYGFCGDLHNLPTVLEWDFKYSVNVTNNNNNNNSSTTTQQHHNPPKNDWSWINTSGVVLSHIQGDPTRCRDVIYTGDSRDPATANQENDYVHETWKGMAHVVRTAPILNQTCLVFFQIGVPFVNTDLELHPVWGRLPATALIMQLFQRATVFLYLDTDALLASPHHSPTTMFQALSHDYDGYGQPNKQQQPALIVNKPYTGWLCGQCERFELDHGCFNTGALLWRRSPQAYMVLQRWWESRYQNETNNFFTNKKESDDDSGSFHGWSGDSTERLVGDRMGEQNRLMYIYGTNPEVHNAVWPVPRQISRPPENSTSCPSDIHGHTPCLQNDFAHAVEWNVPVDQPSCFINHYADEKPRVKNVTALMLQYRAQ
ncbi:expressed unknown protein [Seminavis robusta]|uniref:Nucleotide-diphospho-sugar transferase domain-containing protein n=1 Tax=Seminavis robusta TaxID=568900 RepID=A0A9N8HFH0_9STRA|nr:expressed unknown protein [Seminavis robusta]|eukprot:Sro570_g168530.1 n/a (416) ;mRNA; r:38446-39693